MISIRQATISDSVLIADLSRQTFYETFSPGNTKKDMDKFLHEQFTRGKLMLEVGKEENIFLLAYYGDEVAGYVKLRDGKKPASLNGIPSLEIARLYAVKSMIGKGVGSALMQKCIDIATQRKAKLLWLSVWEKNDRAQKFYTQWGFEKFDTCDFLLGDDIQLDWLMKKDLNG